MKLAEALLLRADLQKKIERLTNRLKPVMIVQAGKIPQEDPVKLMAQLRDSVKKLEAIIIKINKTNIMSIVKRNNLVFPALMNEIFKPDWFGGMENLSNNVPAVNIKENEKDFELELAVPGREKSDFNIEIDDNVLTVSSEVKKEDEISKENYTVIANVSIDW